MNHTKYIDTGLSMGYLKDLRTKAFLTGMVYVKLYKYHTYINTF